MMHLAWWTGADIDEYEKTHNCECGNRCYRIVGGAPGNFLVARAHAPAGCPFNCEDCMGEESGTDD